SSIAAVRFPQMPLISLCLYFFVNATSTPALYTLSYTTLFRSAVTTRGYRPVLAHPERYLYLQDNLERIEDLANRGVLFQLNLGSLAGFYSRAVQVMAGRLIDRKLVHFLGSDCHNLQHAEGIARVARSRYFEKAINLRLINHDL